MTDKDNELLHGEIIKSAEEMLNQVLDQKQAFDLIFQNQMAINDLQ